MVTSSKLGAVLLYKGGKKEKEGKRKKEEGRRGGGGRGGEKGGKFKTECSEHLMRLSDNFLWSNPDNTQSGTISPQL